MTEDDRKLVKRISQGLYAAQMRLAEQQNGVSEWSSEPTPEDRANARLELDKNQIREMTSRTTVRDVLVEQFANEFRRDPNLSVVHENGSIVLQTKTDVERGSFTSLAQLEAFVAAESTQDENEEE